MYRQFTNNNNNNNTESAYTKIKWGKTGKRSDICERWERDLTTRFNRR